MRSVPVGRRSLFVERRRALLGVGGVAVTLLMVLLLDGVFAGSMRQITRYIDTSPADVIVAQTGVRNMHMAASAVPLDALQTRLTGEQFDAMHYGGMAAYKMGIILLNLVPLAALSIVTNTFRDGAERNKALGAWGAVAGAGGWDDPEMDVYDDYDSNRANT
jgi:hypothetical protein